MWCASRRSNKIKNELIICSAKVIKSIKKVLDDSIENGRLKISTKNTEEMSKVLLAMFNGIAFEMLMEPGRNLEDRKYWLQVKYTILSILKSQ